MKSNRLARRVKVSADGSGLVSRAGALLLRGLTVETGLAAGWTEALLDTYKGFPAVHLPGRVLADLAVMIADGGTPSAIWRCCVISPSCSARLRRILTGVAGGGNESMGSIWRCCDRYGPPPGNGPGRLVRARIWRPG